MRTSVTLKLNLQSLAFLLSTIVLFSTMVKAVTGLPRSEERNG
jgi:Na+/pantothenate symporter